MRLRDEPWYPVDRDYDARNDSYLYITNDGSRIRTEGHQIANFTKIELLTHIKNRWEAMMRGQQAQSARQAFEAYHDAKSRALCGEPGLIIKSPDSETKSSVKPLTRNLEGEITMFGEFKQYLASNRNVIFTLLIAALVDKFFLNGALASRLQTLLGKVVEKAENEVGV